MTLIEAVRGWLRTYTPLLEGQLNVDCLPVEARTYSVDVVPCTETVKRYLDGSSVQQFLFVLASRDFHGEDIGQNTDNLAFYEDFSRWVGSHGRRGKSLPDLGEGRIAQRVEVTTSGYPFQMDEHGTARYQIQMKLTYFQKGEI